MTEHDLIYLAGLFDGEGSIGIWSNGKKNGKRIEMEIKMAHEPIMDWLVATFGGTKVSRPQPNGWEHQWRWRVTGGKARRLYRAVSPHLKIKTFLL